MFLCTLRLHPATPGWGVLRACVCLGSGCGFAPPLLAGLLGCACLYARSACTPPLLAGVCPVGVRAWARVSAAPRHFWLGCAVSVCVLGLGFGLRPATPGWGVGVCVCLSVGSACTPPLLAGCAVWVCLLGLGVSAAPCHSWLRCWGVRVCVRAPLVPRHSWFGCAVWACVLWLGFWLRPATPGWAVRRGCVCLGSGFGCAPPLLAGVMGCVCAGVCAQLVPRHSWLGCAVRVCVLGLGFRLRPATPGWGVWVLCVLVCALSLYPATPGWSVRCGRVCLGSGFAWAPPLLAGLLGCACLCARSAGTLPLLAVVCVLGLGFSVRPATPGLTGGVCVFVCAVRLYPVTPGWVCGVGVCPRARVSAAPRHSWLGCWGLCVFVCALRLYPASPGSGVRCGCVCLGSGSGCASPLLAALLGSVCLCARPACALPLLAGVCSVLVCCPLAPVLVPWSVVCCARCSALRHPVAIVAWHLSVCLSCGRRRASLACMVAPRGAQRLVRSGRSRCSGRFSGRHGDFPHPGGLRPRVYWVAVRGTRRLAEDRAHCACRWPPPRQGCWARSALYPLGAQ